MYTDWEEIFADTVGSVMQDVSNAMAQIAAEWAELKQMLAMQFLREKCSAKVQGFHRSPYKVSIRFLWIIRIRSPARAYQLNIDTDSTQTDFCTIKPPVEAHLPEELTIRSVTCAVEDIVLVEAWVAWH